MVKAKILTCLLLPGLIGFICCYHNLISAESSMDNIWRSKFKPRHRVSSSNSMIFDSSVCGSGVGELLPLADSLYSVIKWFSGEIWVWKAFRIGMTGKAWVKYHSGSRGRSSPWVLPNDYAAQVRKMFNYFCYCVLAKRQRSCPAPWQGCWCIFGRGEGGESIKWINIAFHIPNLIPHMRTT